MFFNIFLYTKCLNLHIMPIHQLIFLVIVKIWYFQLRWVYYNTQIFEMILFSNSFLSYFCSNMFSHTEHEPTQTNLNWPKPSMSRLNPTMNRPKLTQIDHEPTQTDPNRPWTDPADPNWQWTDHEQTQPDQEPTQTDPYRPWTDPNWPKTEPNWP